MNRILERSITSCWLTEYILARILHSFLSTGSYLWEFGVLPKCLGEGFPVLFLFSSTEGLVNASVSQVVEG